MARRPSRGWGQAPGWAQAFPGWDPLPDPGTLPFRAARSLARWWWPISAITSFLTVVAYVLTHDPQPGLSNRGWLTVVLAAAVVLLLSIHRANRGRLPRAPLARAVAEYAVVALLTVLLATAGGPPPAQAPEDGAGRQPPTEQPADRQRPVQDRGRAAEHANADTAADRRPGIVRVATGVWGWLAKLWRTAGELADRRSSPTSTTTPRPTARALPAPSTWRSHA
jgi:hypothetical protein